MMKKITFLFALLTVSFGFSQTLPFDFSDPGQVFDWDPSGGTGGTAQITSEKLEVFGNGDSWDNAFMLFSGGDVVDLSDAANNTISFTMQSTTAPVDEVHTHRIKLGTTAGVFEVDFTTIGQDIQTYFINPPALGDLNELRFFVDRNSADNGTYLIDDIQVVPDPAPTCDDGIQNGDEEGIDCGGTGGCPDCPGPPTTAATTPTRDPGDVFSIYSDAYTDAPFNADQVFAGATLNPITVEANNTLELLITTTGGGFQRQFFTDGGAVPPVAPLDLTGYTHMHLDIYFNGTPSVGSIFKVIVQDFSTGGGVNIEENFDVNGLATDQWHALDVAFADFDTNSGAARSEVSQLIHIAAGPVFGDIYVDNIYFYNEPTAGIDDFAKSAFKIFPNPTQDRWNIRSQSAIITSIRVYDVLGKNVLSIAPNKNETTINGALLNPGMYFVKINTPNGQESLKLVKK
ncbi:T9SS type A sorting domain-containing protein [Aestuariivivens sediminis]|uniref:T9SS type A sorting domain-containing protein n=1 Tax=Aestuariivivens sediminis TaxID=2913557 RepID=UPI001F587280|nr:T9SS type A sorting domain-containing protein [Aestuariivivens sediminis]